MSVHHFQIGYLKFAAATVLRTGRYSLLFIMMVVLYLAYPILGNGNSNSLSLDLLTSITLIALVIAVGDSTSHLRIGATLAIASLILIWLEPLEGSLLTLVGEPLILAAFESFTLVLILANIFAQREIGPGQVVGAATSYLLLGFIWANLFALTQYLSPLSFVLLGHEAEPLTSAEFVYFSFTNLTALGYGDILPVHRMARALSALEAISGQLFMVLLVGRVVGLSLRER